jgi:hypothetical protein
VFYHAHNVQFGASSALMSGDAEGGLAIARPFLTHALTLQPDQPWDQGVAGTAYSVEGRYATPEEVLALPEPALPYLKAMWRYARGEALARKGDVAGVRRELAQVQVDASALKSWGPFGALGVDAIKVARLVLEGRAAMLENKPKVAAKAFRKAAELEESRFADQTDPPVWWYAPRRDLALALLATGDARGAADEARAALTRRLRDPVSLAILARAERKLGMTEAADTHMAEARKAWAGEAKALELASL